MSAATATTTRLHPPPSRFRRLLVRWLLWWGVLGTVLAGLIAFGTRPSPPPMASLSAEAYEAERSEPAAAALRFRARDGAELAYRSYPRADPGSSPVVAILIHGSAGSSLDMNVLGRALAAAGVPAIAPDIRGQGLSGRRGDIDYIGQLEDDLTDLVMLTRQQYPGARLVLIGHSSGGGLVLRIAGESVGKSFSRFVLLSPYLGHAAVTARPAAGGWVSVYTPRIVGLSILNEFRITVFNGLPVLEFALPPEVPAEAATRFWSYRMMMNFGPHGESDLVSGAYKLDVARSPGPVTVVAGSDDEIFYADRYVAAFDGAVPPVTVRIVPGVDHMGIVSTPTAVAAILETVKQGQ